MRINRNFQVFTRFSAVLTSLVSSCHLLASQNGGPGLAVMQQVPPTVESQVTFKNHHTYPMSKWAFRNMSAPLNGLMIAREGNIKHFKTKSRKKLGVWPLKDVDNNVSTFTEIFERSDTDGVVVLHKGKIVFEQYFGEMTEHDLHIWYSMTKSLVSSAFGILVEQGKVDLQASPAKYIPELKGSGFERVSIQDVLNHASAIAFKENYTDYNSDFARYYAPALNTVFIPGGRDVQPGEVEVYGVHDFLSRSIKADQAIRPGLKFDYNSANADVLGWLIARISGLPLREFLQQNIWSKLGTEHDAYIAADRAYQAVATGGMNSSLRDAARFAQMVMQKGRFNGKQIVPEKWLEQHIRIDPGDVSRFKQNQKYKNDPWRAYKNMWWILDEEAEEFAAVGIFGQVIYINRKAKTVVAYFSSQPVASAAAYKPFHDKLTAARQVAERLGE